MPPKVYMGGGEETPRFFFDGTSHRKWTDDRGLDKSNNRGPKRRFLETLVTLSERTRKKSPNRK